MRQPSSVDSENALIGFLLTDRGEYPQIICSILESDDFYNRTNRKLFDAIGAMVASGAHPNRVSVEAITGLDNDELDARISKASGVLFEDAHTFTKEIKRCSNLRKILKAAEDCAAGCGKDGATVDIVMDGLERAVYHTGVAGIHQAADASGTVKDVIAAFRQRLADGGYQPLSTGILSLDRAILGLRKGKVMVVGARPGVGKTALAGTLAHAVISQGFGVLTFSLEMDAEELVERTIGGIADVNIRKIMSAKGLTPGELLRIEAASLPENLWFIDDRTYSMSAMRRRAKIIQGRLARDGKSLGLVVVDYLQLAGSSASDSVSREQSVAEVSRGLKIMSKEMGCTVLALSQLNRSCEYRDDKRPMLSDLRESGAIEQDADVVAFLYREWMYNKACPPEDTELIIAKHRGGPCGVVKIRYKEKTCQFTDQEFQTNDRESNSNGHSKETEISGYSGVA